MNSSPTQRLDRTVDIRQDHVLGSPTAALTLVEYGSYICPHCHAAHEVVSSLRDRFGDRLRYVFRQFPLPGDDGLRSAALAEYAGATTDMFWAAHDELMRRGPAFAPGEMEAIARQLDLPEIGDNAVAWENALRRVEADAHSARASGARGTPTFFINGRRYEGAWDEASLAEALQNSLSHRMQTATLSFARWAPSTGLMLAVTSILAVVLSNTMFGPAFESWWHMPVGFAAGDREFSLPLLEWINSGLLSVFFLVVGLEIKHEVTVGRLASRRAAALPVAASLGGMLLPALLYTLVVGGTPYGHGWGLTIATDTAFAIALIAILGDRVPVDLRVFLTAAVIVDDLAAIVVVALFYSGSLSVLHLFGAAAITLLLVLLNRTNVYRTLPYAVLGIALWVMLHQAGLHATLAGVILALVTPTRPPPNLRALTAQAQAILVEEMRAGDAVMKHGPSEPALRALDAIHDRIESPASKLLRTVTPWSSYVVLPLFALANAGVEWTGDAVASHARLMAAIIIGLVVGKPLGIFAGAWLAARAGVATKPDAYSWRQLAGAGAVAGIGFTMSLFIAGQAFRDPADFAAAKVAIFTASVAAGCVGLAILWRRPQRPATD
jgi:NhaA family Na+:H+ antiporter